MNEIKKLRVGFRPLDGESISKHKVSLYITYGDFARFRPLDGESISKHNI